MGAFADLVESDQRTLHYVPGGLACVLHPDEAVEYQSALIADAVLVDAVREGLRSRFDRLRDKHVQGVTDYANFACWGSSELVAAAGRRSPRALLAGAAVRRRRDSCSDSELEGPGHRLPRPARPVPRHPRRRHQPGDLPDIVIHHLNNLPGSIRPPWSMKMVVAVVRADVVENVGVVSP